MVRKDGQRAAERCEVVLVDETKVRAAEADLVDGLTATRLAETFQALSDPTRVRIISALARQELCVCDLAATLGMSPSAISHQLRLLRVMGLVRYRKEGRWYTTHWTMSIFGNSLRRAGAHSP